MKVIGRFQSFEVDRSTIPSTEVALIPGNPGVPHYYCGLGEELQKSFEAEGLDSPTILGLRKWHENRDLRKTCFQHLFIKPKARHGLTFAVFFFPTWFERWQYIAFPQKRIMQTSTKGTRTKTTRLTAVDGDGSAHIFVGCHAWGSTALVMWIFLRGQQVLQKDRKQVLYLWQRTANLLLQSCDCFFIADLSLPACYAQRVFSFPFFWRLKGIHANSWSPRRTRGTGDSSFKPVKAILAYIDVLYRG